MAERGIIFKDDFVSTPGKSWFDMSFDFLFSMNFGELIPSVCMECMGGDVIHSKSDSFVRLAPLVAPTFGKANMFSYNFYVRNYSIWKGWRAFYADGDQRESWQQTIGGEFIPPEMPHIYPHKIMSMLHSLKYQLTPVKANADSIYTDGFNVDYQSVGDGMMKFMTDYSGPAFILYYSNDQAHSYIVPSLSKGITLDKYIPLYTHNETIIIPFAWNKYERGFSDDDNGFANVVKEFYNPFSNGSLFDYLGLDLSGHYDKVNDWLDGALKHIREIIHDDDPYLSFDSAFSPDIIDDIHLSALGNEIPAVFTREFLTSHYIFGLIYSHNSQICAVTTSNVKSFAGYDTDYEEDFLAANFDNIIDLTAKISTLPLRAYHSIYIDYFRDENYISVNKNIDFARDGEDIGYEGVSLEDIFDYLTLNIKAYEHDPYTTALPQAQRGAPVRFMTDANLRVTEGAVHPESTSSRGLSINSDGSWILNATTSGNNRSDANVVVDLSAATIENFRFANATQKLLEKIARSGNRYYEYMRAIYGVVVDDAKIDRPIWLSGDKSPIQISEVLQTSASEVTTDQPLGQMAGRGVSVANDDYISYIAPDAGFFIKISCALPRTNYQQGLAPMFHRFDRLDFAIPDYAQLGEQQVPQRELWYSANNNDDEIPFGYQSRYYDMKYQRDRTSGSFKDSLSFWTWSRIFDKAPIAGREFLEVRPDYRQFAVTDPNAEHIYVHMWNDVQVNRALPVFGTPKL